MGGVHTLVAEDPADLIHPLQAAHNAHLQMQLRGDAQVHVQIQGVVVGDKGPGGRAAGSGIEHRGLHLDEALGIEPVADLRDDTAALDKGLPHFRIHDQVHKPLPVPQLRVLEAVELFRQGPEGFG